MNMLHTFSGGGNDAAEIELKERLIASVKKEVKQLMEESVTKKYIHEESSSVISLCGAVDTCLSHGLRRRALGLFKTSSTTALIQKIARTCPEADYINQRLIEIEEANECHTLAGKRSSSSSDSIIKPKIINKEKGCSSSANMLNTLSSGSSASSSSSGTTVKYQWIRLALFEKCLSKIIEYLVNNANNFYDRDAIVADPDYGSILSSLLVGPCALEFTRAKTADHFWSDPPAGELVQRHRISSGNRTPPTCHRGFINYKRSLHTSSDDMNNGVFKTTSLANVAKDYVESLHQNSKTTLLYAKNNVLVLPKDMTVPMPGYLSLHQTVESLYIKWTPNQLMNGNNDSSDVSDKNSFWSYALNINIDEIVYVHCHQNRGEDTGGTVILVGQDGVQRPPIHFPEGGHMQAFLSCLETGLLPHGQLDPPLWSQRGIGKIFPWPRRMRRRILSSVIESSIPETSIDYVFRVVSKSQHEQFLATHPILEVGRSSPRRKYLDSVSTTGSSDCSSKSLSVEQSITDNIPLIQASQTASIELVCSTMRRQIISRAFYGWLAYCRHLSTVRTHLSGLVNGRITPDLATDEGGLTQEKWQEMHTNGIIAAELDTYRLVYFGGVQHEIRKDVWPYLLGHYSFGSTPEQREQHDQTCKRYYETTMSEWLAVEAIVRQREKEKNAQALAKINAEKTANGDATESVAAMSNSAKHVCRQHEMENDDIDVDIIFDEDEDDISDISDPGDEYEAQIRNEQAMAEQCTTRDSEKDEGYQDEEHCESDEPEKSKAGDGEPEMTGKLLVEEGFEQSDVVVELSKIDDMEALPLQENCFAEALDGEVEGEAGLTPDQGGTTLVLSIKSSPSTSSYETVGTEFVDSSDLHVHLDVGFDLDIAMNTVENSHDGETDPKERETPSIQYEGQIGVTEDAVTPEMEDEDVHRKFHSVDNLTDVIVDTIDFNDVHVNGSENLNSTHVIITEAVSLDALQCDDEPTEETSRKTSLMSPLNDDITVVASLDALQGPKSACVSPASSNGGVYSCELLENFGLNLHRIEKDVQRCDRNYWYFANENLDKLRNVISTYVWENLEIGYMQGMCDLVAPLLVIFDDESLTYSCFCKLMERMIENFPNGGAMDMHFANMRSLIQILDSEMYDLMDSDGDYTHFYFCYRWFLLDFKRELVYDDVFATWEIIWAAKQVASGHFVLFLALALLETYRDIILSNSMNFTDVIKFFNEMAERHDAHSILKLSRSLVLQLQTIIENK